MKKIISGIILTFLLSCSGILYSQEESDAADSNYPLFETENAPPPQYPFALSGQYLKVEKAPFRTKGFKDQHLRYGQWDVAFAYTHPISKIWGLIFGSGWVGTEVDMSNNPEFSETNFNYVNFSVGGFTKAFPSWTWTMTLAAFLDTEEFSFSDYALYQGVLWGKYDVCKWLELNFGLILELGLRKEKVWPILGFIYTPCRNWRINAVYPINIAVEYEWSPCWKIAGSVRFLRNRHRVQKEEFNSQGIFEYHTTGAELDLIFSPLQRLSIKGFAGKTFDGDLKVTDRNDKHSIHYKFEGSFYSGVSAVFSF